MQSLSERLDQYRKECYTVSGDGKSIVIKGTWSIHVTGIYTESAAMSAGISYLRLHHPLVNFTEFRLYAIGESQYSAKPILIESKDSRGPSD